MKVLKHLMIIASIAAIPTLSFAQQATTPMNDTATSAASMHDTQSNQNGAQYQQPSRVNSTRGDNSGYGAPMSGSSQSSTTRFVGKNSPVFNH